MKTETRNVNNSDQSIHSVDSQQQRRKTVDSLPQQCCKHTMTLLNKASSIPRTAEIANYWELTWARLQTGWTHSLPEQHSQHVDDTWSLFKQCFQQVGNTQSLPEHCFQHVDNTWEFTWIKLPECWQHMAVYLKNASSMLTTHGVYLNNASSMLMTQGIYLNAFGMLTTHGVYLNKASSMLTTQGVFGKNALSMLTTHGIYLNNASSMLTTQGSDRRLLGVFMLLPAARPFFPPPAFSFRMSHNALCLLNSCTTRSQLTILEQEKTSLIQGPIFLGMRNTSHSRSVGVFVHQTAFIVCVPSHLLYPLSSLYTNELKALS